MLDDSTYGHKLLMKMGWNKGKGLGKNEDGIKENVKVKFRNTNSGIVHLCLSIFFKKYVNIYYCTLYNFYTLNIFSEIFDFFFFKACIFV